MAAAAGSQHRCVFVGNIPYDATEEQLIQICEEVGPVVSFRLVLDRETGKPKGYGFCEYKDEETALSARRNLQGYEINGRQLRVDFAENDKGADRNREKGHGGPGFTSTNDAHKPPVIGDSSLHQPIGHPLAASAASSMAKVLGGRLPSGLQNLSGLGNDSLTQYLAKMSRQQLNEIMTEMKALAVQNKALAQQLLQGCPQLLTALFQAQIMLGMVTPQMMQMSNSRQSSSSIPQHALQNSIPNQSPLLPSHLGQSQASSASQNLVMLQQTSIPLHQLPVQPPYQHPLPVQPQKLLQGTASGKSGLPQHQNFGSLPNQPQLPPLPTSKSLMSQVQLPALQHSRTHGATNIVQQPQPHFPDNLQQSYLPTPLTSQSGYSNYPALPNGLNSLSTEAGPYASHDLTWAFRGSTHSTSGMGLAARTGTTGETSEVTSHRSKRQKTEDGGKAHFTMTDTFSTISSVPALPNISGPVSGSQMANTDELQHSEKQMPQLPPEVESALLQQVMHLTPEQLSSLPLEQQQQVLQLQQMLVKQNL